MKEPIDSILRRQMDLGNPNHPLARYNSFDLGSSYPTQEICLVMRRYANVNGERKTPYPMLASIGEGYGSLKIVYDNHADNITKQKIYPLLVHVLKVRKNDDLFALNSSGKDRNAKLSRYCRECHLKESRKTPKT